MALEVRGYEAKMNKREFIERLIDMGGCGAKPKSWARGWDDAIGEVIGIAEELDESQKPTIPQFVADWIEDYRDHGGLIVDMLDSLTTELDSVSSVDNEVAQWFRENTEKMLKALMDGYEVEKEKLYRIKFSDNQYASRFNNIKINSILTDEELAAQYTEAEIKAIDERYWAFAEEVCHV